MAAVPDPPGGSYALPRNVSRPDPTRHPPCCAAAQPHVSMPACAPTGPMPRSSPAPAWPPAWLRARADARPESRLG